MRAAVLVTLERIHIEERPIPQPGPGEALVRVHYVAICGSDQACFWGRESSADEPVVMGHEFSGRVVALGDGVTAPMKIFARLARKLTMKRIPGTSFMK